MDLLPGYPRLVLLLSWGVSSIRSFHTFGGRPEPKSQNQLFGIARMQFQDHSEVVQAFICDCRGNFNFLKSLGGQRLSQVAVEFTVISKGLPVGRNEPLQEVEHFQSPWSHRKPKACTRNTCSLAAASFT